MNSPSPKGVLLHRLCPGCDREVREDRTSCPDCGSKLVEVRDEVDTTVGTVIDDRFEVRAKIGQGGMGTVYRAWQKSIGREVAIKLMDRSYSRDAMAVRRFFREARLASQLSQPNTVSVFDFGQAADGRLFIAMELIRGRTLHQVVQTEGAFSIERCVRVGTQICDALEAAHTLGIVHRDLKLENVILLDHPPGRDLIKVLDFGLAKNIRDPGSHATESGIVVGTPRYMSPEAATTGTTGPAGDVYSLGVILGELAGGKPMWSGDTLTELIAQKLDPRPAVARSPAQLRPLLQKILDPEPERRPTAEQVRVLLAKAAASEPSAGDTMPDQDTEAGATTNLRSMSPRPKPGGGDVTRQLTPDHVALAAALATPRPARAQTPQPESSLGASQAGAIPAIGSPSLVDLERPPVRRWPLVAVGLAALASIVVVIVLASRGDDTPPAAVASTPVDASVPLATPDAAPIAPDAAPAAVPAVVTIRVTSEPPGARVTYGKETKPAPFEITVARGTQPIVLTAKQPGRTAGKLEIIPDEDRTATFKLRRYKPAADDEAAPF